MSLTNLRLRYYTDDEIRSLAVVRVLNASTYDRGVPKVDGVNDARMGLADHTIRCPTCYKSNCNQHYGYIELSRPVFRLGSINLVLMVLRMVCRECASLKCSKSQFDEVSKHQKNQRDILKTLSELCRNKLICPECQAPQPMYTKRERTFIDATYRPKELQSDFVKSRGPEYIEFLKTRFMPDDAASILHKLEQNNFFLKNVNTLMCKLQIVPPPIIRPSNFAGQTRVRSENDLTIALQDIVRSNNELEKASPEDRKLFFELYDKLQVYVSGLVNHSIKRTASQNGLLPIITSTSKRKVIDLKTRLNGKKARIRGNLSGKRVDQSGRTVIAGDSSHDIDQLGLPSCMMNKLTFPEPVNTINLASLQKCIIAGAYVNFGALAVRPPSHEIDRVIWLPILDLNSRIDLASQIRIGWIVERHLIDGDIVLFNRQPSLWKASMMSFKIYRVAGFAARLPLPVTRAFNADFDGDEMNVHVLQGYEAIAEARELMKVDKQIITPQSGTVIIGLVQDSLVGAYRMTSKDTLFTREEALTLLCSINYAVSGRSCKDTEYADSDFSESPVMQSLPEPAILKPRLWTGKQLVSCLLPTKINLQKSGDPMNDDTVIIVNGDLINGRLSKATLGASNTGIIQSIWRLFGPGGSHKFISDAQRLFVSHLAMDGPCQSIVDCLVKNETESKSIQIMSRGLRRADEVLNLDLPEGVKEAKSNSILQEILRSVGSNVLKDIRTESGLSNCVNSGSKGNVMNIAQIGGCVGQQNIYGRRIPMRQTNLGLRTLIYYSPGDLRPEARGFVANSYLSGLSPAEFFEHQMAGREGIVATAVNTSETGYNQRRMVKGQESQCVSYDGTVRVSNNNVIQTFYGSDDLDGSRMERIHLPWILDAEKKLGHMFSKVQKYVLFLKEYMAWNANMYKDLDFHFSCAISVQNILSNQCEESEVPIEEFAKLICGTHSRHHSSKRSLLNVSICCAVLQMALHLTSSGLSKTSANLLVTKYSQALVNPGEGVGALGASSIGEPSMQKTLNTFHYTGIADKNVTITGLPRFKQLINGVDTYETANLTAKIKSFELSSDALQSSVVMLSDVIQRYTLQSTASLNTNIFLSTKGPLYTKFAKQPDGICESITIILNWTLCARRNVTIDTVARSIRSTFGADAFVLKNPHWHGNEGPQLTIYFAPWITGHDAIASGLLSQLQIRGIDYIKNVIVLQESRYDTACNKSSQHSIETEGSNIIHMAACPFIVPETIRSTNVSEVFTVLGISAGVAVLQSELHKVLSFDGTYVDTRHSWLLSDTMARCGSLAAMNRHHMADLGSSFLQEASFERSLEVFEEGAAFGREDSLSGSTERIIVGQPVSIGTGLVGIISLQNIEEVSQVLVEPLDSFDHKTTNHEIVRPLHNNKQEDYKTDEWSKELHEYSKIPSDTFIEETFRTFRSIAASRRSLPRIEFKYKITESFYKSILKSCWTYSSWTTSEQSQLYSKVYWSYAENKEGLTIINSKQEAKSYSKEVVSRSNLQNCEINIFLQDSLEPLDLPFGVETIRVEMCQINYFSKGNFFMSLSKEWSASTNIEAEELLLKTRGCPYATIGILDTETILRNRCTDAQLANAVYGRMPL